MVVDYYSSLTHKHLVLDSELSTCCSIFWFVKMSDCMAVVKLGAWPLAVHTSFLEIVFVHASVCVCLCVHSEGINNQWCDIGHNYVIG